MTLAALAADIARAHLARQSPAPAGEEDAPEVVSLDEARETRSRRAAGRKAA